MRKIIFVIFLISTSVFSQKTKTTEVKEYKKKVLESIEVDILMSYYKQDGSHASVTGGIGDENLTDYAGAIVVQIPLNEDDILTVDVGVSAYTSASSSNLDPFDASGASGNGDDDDDDNNQGTTGVIEGSPWVASSGASEADTWGSVGVKYSHSSDDRNTIWGVNGSFSTEYDYSSIGLGGSFTKLFNQKNTEIGISGQVFIDAWAPKYPTELDTYIGLNDDLNTTSENNFFANVDILDQQGNMVSLTDVNAWAPHKSELLTTKDRRTYNVSLSFSQILSKKAQFSLFMDIVRQEGWLANPMQRVYFADKSNYYIGNAASIPNYESPTNTNVFHLADDIERLPSSRLKIPIGARFNYYVNENVVVNTYYRYYTDDWGIKSHTADIEIPIKFNSGKFTVYPNYRYYIQTAADYFAPYNAHQSTSTYYTSDYDLSKFDSHQYGFGFKYTDVLGKLKIAKFGLKSIDLRYSNYNRSDGLKSNIISAGIKFVMD